MKEYTVHTYVFTEYCTAYTLSDPAQPVASTLLLDKYVCMYSLQLFFFSPELNLDYRLSGC